VTNIEPEKNVQGLAGCLNSKLVSSKDAKGGETSATKN